MHTKEVSTNISQAKQPAELLRTAHDAMSRYLFACTAGPSDYLRLYGNDMISRFMAQKPAQKDPRVTVLIPTYKPTTQILWTLDQLSRQAGDYGGMAISVFHNGLAKGSAMPKEIEVFMNGADITLKEEPKPLGVRGARTTAMKRHFDERTYDDPFALVATIDDDTGPVFPSWAANAVREFNIDPSLVALYSPLIYPGTGSALVKSTIYKGVTTAGQWAIQATRGCGHNTEGIAVYREQPLLQHPRWNKETDYNLIDGTALRLMAASRGTVRQSFSPKALCFNDPDRISARGGFARQMVTQIMLHAPNQQIRAQGKQRYENMYTRQEIGPLK